MTTHKTKHKGELVDFPGLNTRDTIINNLIREREDITGIAVAFSTRGGQISTNFSVGFSFIDSVADIDHTIYRLHKLRERLIGGE
jgi:hypothetical protein